LGEAHFVAELEEIAQAQDAVSLATHVRIFYQGAS